MLAQIRRAETSGRFRTSLCTYVAPLVLGLLTAGFMSPSRQAAARAPGERRCVIVELYHEGEDDAYQAASEAIAKLASSRRGVHVVQRNVRQEANRTRHRAITKYYRIADRELPVAYAANRLVAWKGDGKRFLASCEAMLEMEVFVRRGCQHCARAKSYLTGFAARYPPLRIVYRDLVTERRAVSDLNALVRKHRKAAASVPVFHACDQILVGFDRPETTGPRLEKIFDRWTTPCSAISDRDTAQSASNDASNESSHRGWTQWSARGDGASITAALLGLVQQTDEDTDAPPELPLPMLDQGLPLPDEPYSSAMPLPADQTDETQLVDLPWFGQLDTRRVGLPVLTLAIGLVDGFNPCAMWVLLFLLSLLVNLRDRVRILAVAGSFVIVSGLAYFAFMAAWLNVFLLIGLLRPVQVFLGVLGITVGAIHVKDFFAFKQGISLSIPESAKPGIYARTRAIITAENLTGAILGAVTLAVLVNIVELLCTAGLPALYTEILASYQLPIWRNYMYLGLYIAAYMLDDSLMVAVVVLTLSKRRLQETHGRWLKLVSGVVIIALGFVVMLQPEWLM